MSGIRAILFDLDGTLLDTLGDLHTSLNESLTQNGFAPRTIDETRAFVGNGIAKLVERALPQNATAADFDAVFDCFGAHYSTHYAIKTRPYDGIPALLERLHARGIRIGVVSNKFEPIVADLCKTYFGALIDAPVGDRPGLARKPSPEPAVEALRLLGCSPENALHVGDSDVDLEMAKNARLTCISVCWGFRTEAFLRAHGANLLARTPDELERLIQNRIL